MLEFGTFAEVNFTLNELQVFGCCDPATNQPATGPGEECTLSQCTQNSDGCNVCIDICDENRSNYYKGLGCERCADIVNQIAKWASNVKGG